MRQRTTSTDAGLKTLPTVMVVDDSLTVRRVTQRLLSREGYQVVLAKDGSMRWNSSGLSARRDAGRHRDAADGWIRPDAQRPQRRTLSAHPDHHDHVADRGGSIGSTRRNSASTPISASRIRKTSCLDLLTMHVQARRGHPA